MNRRGLRLKDLNGLPLGLKCKVPDVFGVSKQDRDHQQGPQVLVANEEEHVRDVNRETTAVHEAVYDVLDHVHVIAESFHDAAVGSHIEECVDWGVHDAFEDVGVYLFQGLVDQYSHHPLFGDLTDSLEEDDDEDFEYVCPEFGRLLLLGLVFSPLSYQVT